MDSYQCACIDFNDQSMLNLLGGVRIFCEGGLDGVDGTYTLGLQICCLFDIHSLIARLFPYMAWPCDSPG